MIRQILTEEIDQDVERYVDEFENIKNNIHGFHGAHMPNEKMRFGKLIPGPQFEKEGPVTDGEIKHALNYLNKYKPTELVVYSRGSAVWAAAQDKAGTADDYPEVPDELKKITYLAPAAKRPDWGQQTNELTPIGSGDEVLASTSDGRVPLAQAAQVAKETGGNMKIYKPAWMVNYDLEGDPTNYGKKGHTTPLRFDPSKEKVKQLSDDEIKKIINTFPNWKGAAEATAGEIKKQEDMADELMALPEIRKYVRSILLEKKAKKKKKKRKVKCPLLPNGKRDYKCEYRKYGGASKKGKKERAARNKARKQAEKMGLVRKGDGMELDHIMPLSLGGSNDQTNWQVMSRADNRRKGKKWDGRSGTKMKESLQKKSHEQKIIEMIATGEAANVIQALSLAEAVGLIEVTEFRDLVPQGHPYATHSYEFSCTSSSFRVELALLAPKVSKGFYRQKTDVLVSVYRNNECHIFVNQQ